MDMAKFLDCTGLVCRMPHRKWREIKQQLSCWPELALHGCILVSLHLWGILHTSTVRFCLFGPSGLRDCGYAGKFYACLSLDCIGLEGGAPQTLLCVAIGQP